MFGRRSDGKKVKNIDPFMRLVPHIMFDRTDAMVMQNQDYDCAGIDEFIKEMRAKEKIRFSYLDILTTAIVRTIAKRPKLNRFIVNGRIYKRNAIQISLAIKKKLVDSAAETTVKLTFDGTESIYEVKERLDAIIKANKGIDKVNKTDKIAGAIVGKMPNFVIKFMVKFLKWMDKHGMLPKSIIDGSPMHTSVFLVHSKSIRMDPVLHHIYNFGTTGMFVSMGQEKLEPVIVDRHTKEIVIKKLLKAGLVVDERISDGVYNSLSMTLFKKYMEDPTQLLEKNDEVIEDEG